MNHKKNNTIQNQYLPIFSCMKQKKPHTCILQTINFAFKMHLAENQFLKNKGVH